MSSADDIFARKISYDIATLVRVLPWLMMDDKRGPNVLVKAAFDDVKGFIENGGSSVEERRGTIMRGLVINLLRSLGINPPVDALNVVVAEILQQVDAAVDAQFIDEVQGEVA